MVLNILLRECHGYNLCSLKPWDDAPIVAIPAARGEESYDHDAAPAPKFRRLGAKNITVLHTYYPEVAGTDEFAGPLIGAKGVWFGGDRQWRLADAYVGTPSEKLFWEVLKRDGVIGETSAGASIQGSFLARGDTGTTGSW
ncbi:hypothetical protein DL767_001270 [Monosporascus sp. MG133]|nr:hypothetical protein DL767_001270 [Monosporascus sp. MG133]